MCDVKKSISVPTNCIGKIIGRGGQNIRALESDTQAKVQISRDKSGLDTEIILIGTDNQILDVEGRIRKLMANDRGPPRNSSYGRNSNSQVEHENNWDNDESQVINSQVFTQKRREGNDWRGSQQSNRGQEVRNDWGYSQNTQTQQVHDDEEDWGYTQNTQLQQGYANNQSYLQNTQPQQGYGNQSYSQPQQGYGNKQSYSQNQQSDQRWGRAQNDDSQKSQGGFGFAQNKPETNVEQDFKCDWDDSDWGISESNETSGNTSFSRNNDHRENRGFSNRRNQSNDNRFSRDGNNRQQRNYQNDRSSRNQSFSGGNGSQNQSYGYNNASQNQSGNNSSWGKSENTQSVKTESQVFDMKALNEEYDKAQAEYWATFPPIKKIFYQELPEIANMPPGEVEIYRKSLNDLVIDRPLEEGSKKKIPNPVKTFQQAFHNYPEILEEIKKVGFEKPSPIQCQSWPVIMSGEDLIGIAQTGTGKTLAFLLPALIHIDNQTLKPEFEGKPSALVLAPTRELALQIHKEVNKYSYKNIKSLCIYGGADRKAQIAELQQGAQIIIATPGRLDDLVVNGYINPEVITYVVLDEADRMLDMGFEPQIRKTLYKVRPDRQTVMTSATWPNGVRRLAVSYMKNPVQIFVGSLDLTAVHSVEQIIMVMEEEEKFDYFIDFIKSTDESQKIVVFAGKKSKASLLASEMSCMGIYCSSMHGDLEQCDREQAIEDMMNGTERILVATDIISRGIDIENITHVVNYDFPRNIEDYVHRVGRTGRAGRTGMSITYFTWSDARHAEELIRILQEANQMVPRELESMNVRYQKKAAQRASQGGGYNRRY